MKKILQFIFGMVIGATLITACVLIGHFLFFQDYEWSPEITIGRFMIGLLALGAGVVVVMAVGSVIEKIIKK